MVASKVEQFQPFKNKKTRYVMDGTIVNYIMFDGHA